MTPRMRREAGNSTCWQCMVQLQRAPGKGLGLFFFHLMVDRHGFQRRVHGDCLAAAQTEGMKLLAPPEPK